MQGKVLTLPASGRAGLIAGNNGQRYGFDTASLSNGPAREGESVDFQAAGNQAADIYVVRSATLVSFGQRKWLPFFFSPQGRISRREFWLYAMLPIWLVVLFFGWIPIIGWILMAACGWAYVATSFKRFHDRGYAGWWSLIGVVPGVLAMVFFVRWFFTGRIDDYYSAMTFWVVSLAITLAQCALVYFRAGTRGPNKYGPDPLAGA
jgi:uncharacterized membrane protein YhaH (DUF805 family)